MNPCLLALLGAILISSSNAASVLPAFIFNGTAVPRNTYPFTVSLAANGDHFCGGTLISPRVVLTAAHCLDSFPPASSLRARAGGVRLNRPGTFNVYSVSDYVLHPFYRQALTGDPSGPQRVSRNDIAVVYLTENAVEPIAKINVDEPIEAAGAPVTVVGWGTVNAFAFEPSNELLEAELTATSQQSCFSQWAEFDAVIGTGTVCATDLQGRRDACFGDSGGPLLGFKPNGQPRIIGLVSAGDSLCRDRAPGIYTRISDYHCWLDGLGIAGVNAPGGPCPPTRVVPVNGGMGNVPPNLAPSCVDSARAVATQLAGSASCGSTNIRRVVVQALRMRCQSGFCAGDSASACTQKLRRVGRRIIRRTC